MFLLIQEFCQYFLFTKYLFIIIIYLKPLFYVAYNRDLH